MQVRALSAAGAKPRVLVLTAPVGAGHDAASAALAEQLREEGAAVEVIDGLRLLGIERLVVTGYRFQILHAAWSWRLLYRLSRSRLLIWLCGSLLARLSSRRLLARIADREPDVIVSAYPIVSAALAGLRRRARLPWPCATLVTDFDPHPAWIHKNLDANLVVGPASRNCQPISPPTRRVPVAPGTRERVRRELGIRPQERVVLIVGGAWGVGNLIGAARVVAQEPGSHAIVVTGRNQRLADRLRSDPALSGCTVLRFTRRMPELMAASDVLIQNAGGLTCLEAFAAGLPVIMFDPLPGHGEDNARLMARAGLVAEAGDSAALGSMLSSPEFWAGRAPALVASALALFSRASAGERTAGLAVMPVRQPGHARRYRLAVAASITVVAWIAHDHPLAGRDVATPMLQPASSSHAADPVWSPTSRPGRLPRDGRGAAGVVQPTWAGSAVAEDA